MINKNANYYYNEHYNYINNILDSSIPLIAQNNGLKILRKVDAGWIAELSPESIAKTINYILKWYDININIEQAIRYRDW